MPEGLEKTTNAERVDLPSECAYPDDPEQADRHGPAPLAPAQDEAPATAISSQLENIRRRMDRCLQDEAPATAISSQTSQPSAPHKRPPAERDKEQRRVIELKRLGYSNTKIAKATGWKIRKVRRFFEHLRDPTPHSTPSGRLRITESYEGVVEDVDGDRVLVVYDVQGKVLEQTYEKSQFIDSLMAACPKSGPGWLST